LSDNGPTDKKTLPPERRRGARRAAFCAHARAFRVSSARILGPLGCAAALAGRVDGRGLFLSIYPVDRPIGTYHLRPCAAPLSSRLFAAIKRHTIGAKRSQMCKELEDERK
jgi:anti-sigma factor RsiW